MNVRIFSNLFSTLVVLLALCAVHIKTIYNYDQSCDVVKHLVTFIIIFIILLIISIFLCIAFAYMANRGLLYD